MEEISSAFWHTRFSQQAQWTQNLRRYLYARSNLASAHNVLEVGCGTGAILMELTMQSHGYIFGLDLSREHLAFTADHLPGIPLVSGDVRHIPLPSNSFDITLCHYLLLWVSNPLQAVSEMVRVTRPGGAVLAIAEPDYGGRIDFPDELGALGAWQQTSLRKQGADPLTGRKLRAIFQQAGLVEVEAGVMGGQWSVPASSEDWDLEWKIIENDLGGLSDSISNTELERLKNTDRRASQNGERILYVPTFYAWGKKSG